MKVLRSGLKLVLLGFTTAALGSNSARVITGTVTEVNVSQETITVQLPNDVSQRAVIRVGCKTVFEFADGTKVGPRPCELFGFNAETDDLVASVRGKLVSVALHPYIGALANEVRVLSNDSD